HLSRPACTPGDHPELPGGSNAHAPRTDLMLNQPAYRSEEGMLPQNIEAEQAVLGSLLIDPRAIEQVASFLRPEDFYLPVNSEIYAAMLALYELDRPTDIVTLADRLQAHDRLDDTGGAAYLASLARIVP